MVLVFHDLLMSLNQIVSLLDDEVDMMGLGKFVKDLKIILALVRKLIRGREIMTSL